MTGREVVRSFLTAAQSDMPDLMPEESWAKLYELVADPPLAPHAVKVKDAHVAIDKGADGKFTGRAYVGPGHCPDCGAGVSSLGGDMFKCMRLSDEQAAQILVGATISKNGAVLAACGREA